MAQHCWQGFLPVEQQCFILTSPVVVILRTSACLIWHFECLKNFSHGGNTKTTFARSQVTKTFSRDLDEWVWKINDWISSLREVGVVVSCVNSANILSLYYWFYKKCQIISDWSVCTSENVAEEETHTGSMRTCQISGSILVDMSANHYISQTLMNTL